MHRLLRRPLPHFIALLLIMSSLINSQPVGAETVVIDPQQSAITWTGKKVAGEHSGKVHIAEGSAEIKDGVLVGGTFDIDMRSITNTDLTDQKYNKKLVDHLKSDDFFSSETHPEARFVITKATPLTETSAAAPNYSVTGTLTVKGIAQEITFPARVTIDGKNARATAKMALDRTRWNVRYGSGKFFQGLGDKLIYDEFEIELALAGTLQQ
jgi:polyisoprenoid-binding protein YceI